MNEDNGFGVAAIKGLPLFFLLTFPLDGAVVEATKKYVSMPLLPLLIDSKSMAHSPIRWNRYVDNFCFVTTFSCNVFGTMDNNNLTLSSFDN